MVHEVGGDANPPGAVDVGRIGVRGEGEVAIANEAQSGADIAGDVVDALRLVRIEALRQTHCATSRQGGRHTATKK
jgi:hypothetical protein